ncbi:MAG: sigma-70 family RNA polymerase sigma factor, partial [Myxococcota bacterium]
MSPTDPAQRFERHRAKLFALAYRMLGSGTDAEDILQEAALRFLRASAEAEIAQPEGWLVRVVSRLCVDELRRARRKREVYVGPYLPEPEPDPRDYEPFDIAGLSMALLAMMERLSPRERVAFVLHDAFDYGHDAIASVLEVNASNARQILRRARKRLGTAPRFAPSAEAHRAVLMAFAVATQTGDTQALTSLLAEDVSVISDGGGKVPAATRIVSGR